VLRSWEARAGLELRTRGPGVPLDADGGRIGEQSPPALNSATAKFRHVACGGCHLVASRGPQARRCGRSGPGLGLGGPRACRLGPWEQGNDRAEAVAAWLRSVFIETAGYCLTSPPTFQFV
jgi:hypothetical protein